MSDRSIHVDRLIRSRRQLVDEHMPIPGRPGEEEGGCGVVGLIATVAISGKHILEPLVQMHNRGNGKGGGIAAAGLDPAQMGVSSEILENSYLIQIAYLDPSVRHEVEREFIDSCMTIHSRTRIGPEHGKSKGEQGVMHPEVWRYFCRVRSHALERFAADNGLEEADPMKIEDEFVFQNSFRLNEKYYASLGEQKAFVLCHGKNILVFKIVGYAEEAIHYYGLGDIRAHLWIGHQRYPTKGKVWHPGGAHPFVGLNEALVHNGDFANYHSVAQYLAQRNIRPLFLTDTEVSVLLFDLLRRVYGYPLEYVIEALAPTTERDFTLLPEEKQAIYRRIQISHLQGSPDGPWFFIIGRNDPLERTLRLIGITDTSMLRPQVFALQRGNVSIGLIASEKQAIDAVLRSISAEDLRFWPRADKYWNARGGSHTDGGAFVFSLVPEGSSYRLECKDKFGVDITDAELEKPPINIESVPPGVNPGIGSGQAPGTLEELKRALRDATEREAAELLFSIARSASDDESRERAISVLAAVHNERYSLGRLRRSLVSEMAERVLYSLFDSMPDSQIDTETKFVLLRKEGSGKMRAPKSADCCLVIDASGFAPEGDGSLSREMVSAYGLGWRRMIIYRLSGQRFIGCGLGKKSYSLRIDVYGSSGDYLGSGIDGAEIFVHGNVQDQVAQIINRGKLVIYGDVGQAFMYGAKGSEAYILGNTAGRPLINAVGRPRVIINGTSLDYLAESFMAGDPMNGGGFVILNGLKSDGDGRVSDLDMPYPGGNLFSLASGGAIYVRDPDRTLGEEQLNGGQFATFTQADWELILPYLEENERLFGISIRDHLLRHGGKQLEPTQVYRKVGARPLTTIAPTGTG